MDDVRYVGYMRFANHGHLMYDHEHVAAMAMSDTLIGYGVSWEGNLTLDELESMYLGLLVSLGDQGLQ